VPAAALRAARRDRSESRSALLSQAEQQLNQQKGITVRTLGDIEQSDARVRPEDIADNLADRRFG
jgi:protein involved in temperature-dependent protein secretion